MNTMRIANVKVYAMINYMRDKAMGCLDISDTWDKSKEMYLEEAKATPNYILTEDECIELLKLLGENPTHSTL